MDGLLLVPLETVAGVVVRFDLHTHAYRGIPELKLNTGT